MVDFFDRANFYKKNGLKIDVTKPKDVLGKETVKVKDVLNGKDAKIDKMTDIFPKSEQTDDNDLLS